LNQPYTVAVDSLGNVYVAASAQHRVFKISTTGIVTVVAGTGTAGYSGDGGKALNAELYSPWGVAVDAGDPANVYIGDTYNCLVRKVSQSTGIITTVAGKVTHPATGNPYSTCGYSGDNGPADAAELNGPSGLAVNPLNDDVYVADYNNGRVRKIAGGIPTATITTVAGGGGSTSVANNCVGSAPYGDGSTASSAYLCYPTSVSLDTTVNPVNAFISEQNRCDIREVVGSSKDIYQVAGSYSLGCGFKDNVVATSGQLYYPWQSHVSVSGGTSTVTFADYNNVRIRQFALTYAAGVPKPGTLITIAGRGSGGYCGDNGPALSACMSPIGVGFDASGNIYIGDYGSDRVRKITKSSGYISTIDGWGPNGGTITTYSNPVGISNAPGTGLALSNPYGVFADPASAKVYLAGYSEAATYVLNSATGNASDFAGNGVAGFAGDGTLANGAGTELNAPTAFAKDSSGNIYIADQNNCAIREVFASTGGISTIAGGHEGSLNGCGFSGNGGTAVNAKIYLPLGLAIDAANNIYISEYAYCDVRKIAAGTGIITTVAGSPQSSPPCGYSGDGGLATNAKLNQPYDISVDGSGNLYIADTSNQRIRKVDAFTHIVTTVAGDGAAGYNGDGPALGVSLYNPQGIYTDVNGNLFIADYNNDIVRWVSPTGQLITFGGTPPTVAGYYGFGGDGGLATSAQFAYPARITQDGSGNFYIADWNNQRVRKINAFAGFGLSTASLNFETQPAGTISDFQGIAVSPIGPITISNVTTTAGFFEVDDCAGVTLVARQTCEIDVYFNPTSAGKARGTLTITSNAYFPTSGNTVSLTGTGTGLGFTGSLAFGTQLINTTVSRTLTLTNTGSAVAIHGISLSLPTSFKLAGGTCPASGTLAAGGSCTIIVSFDPTTIGSKKDTLVVSNTDAASPLLVPATGNGTEVKLSASALAFGTVTHGTSKTLNLTVTNTASSGTLTISTALSGAGFALASGNTCTTPVAAGKSCVVPVSFAPTAAQSYSGTLTLTTNGGSSPVIPLTGTGN
jgi:sugar lactone lactonase YvrE